jgi:hypothetical protein
MPNRRPSHVSISKGDFQFDEVRAVPRPAVEGAAPAPAAPPLGVLSNFTGEFAGTGFNMIFRPNNGPPPGTNFPTPVVPPPPTIPNNNVLELNLTQETLIFSDALGNVPNRGLGAQKDAFLNVVPYTQAINDVTNPATGKGDGAPTGIHFEPGLWANVPATATTPDLANTLVRMASIPHGTTIEAQCLAPAATIPGPPTILPVCITPFVIGSSPPKLIPFPSQIAANKDTARIPQDLTNFIAAGTINQAVLDDPNAVLREAIAGQKITSFSVFTVATSPLLPVFGGGTDNIAFLEGDAGVTTPNANTVAMTATFWIETVEHTLRIPIFKPGQPPLKIPAPTKPGQDAPVFLVEPPREITDPIDIIVTSTQIQYSQVVFLNFAGLTWPHVSVATLVPTAELAVPPSAWV